MFLRSMYQFAAATHETLSELRKAEQEIVDAARTSENHNFVHAGVLALSEELHVLWADNQKLDMRRREKWFWQVSASDVAERRKIADSARDLSGRLWMLDQGLFHMLPVEFVQDVQNAMQGKRTAKSGSAPVRTVGGDNVRTLPAGGRKRNNRNPPGHKARILQFRRKNKP